MSTGQYPQQRLLCPDCEQWLRADEFVPHREREHPPATRTLTTEGIRSLAAVHGADPEED